MKKKKIYKVLGIMTGTSMDGIDISFCATDGLKKIKDKYPKIIEKYHFCGPGNTYNEISKILGNDKNLFVELSYDSWKKKLLKA